MCNRLSVTSLALVCLFIRQPDRETPHVIVCVGVSEGERNKDKHVWDRGELNNVNNALLLANLVVSFCN